ncbi:MAG: hypothetical protein A4E74_02469 [Syntrophus sp. PtaB.Bin075]|nr:MAG: hypothetical protein A4E74_02469 [Syntrophus sp. PtaB.Bin075]
MDPDRGIRPAFFENRFGKRPVGLFILRPERGSVDDTIRFAMKERPEDQIAEPVIIIFLRCRGEPDPPEGIGGVFRRDPQTATGIRPLPVAAAASPGNPCSPCHPQDRIEGRSDPADGEFQLQSLIGHSVCVGFPVGGDNEPAPELVASPGKLDVQWEQPFHGFNPPAEGCIGPE